MQIKKIAAYTFEELSESSKSRAVGNFSYDMEYPWFHEAKQSLEAFVHAHHGRIIDYSIGSEVYRSYVKTTVDRTYFRGVKLKEFDRDHMPTGYCLDNDLWMTFYDEMKKDGDGYRAFKDAIEAFLCSLASDVESYYSRESVEEQIILNEYLFTEDGEMFHYKYFEECA